MAEQSGARMLIAGVGNRLRRDDGVGPAACDQLRGMLAAQITEGQVELCEEWGEGARLIDLMGERRAVFLIDAASTDSQPGTLHIYDAASGVIPADMLCYSTHRFGVAEAVEVARNLGLMPERVVLYAIEGADFGHGEGLSMPVADTLTEVCRQITRAIARELE